MKWPVLLQSRRPQAFFILNLLHLRCFDDLTRCIALLSSLRRRKGKDALVLPARPSQATPQRTLCNFSSFDALVCIVTSGLVRRSEYGGDHYRKRERERGDAAYRNFSYFFLSFAPFLLLSTLINDHDQAHSRDRVSLYMATA